MDEMYDIKLLNEKKRCLGWGSSIDDAATRSEEP